MNVQDYEIFKFSQNRYTEFENNGQSYLLNEHPYLDIVLTDKCNANCWFCCADLIHKKLDCDIEKFKAKILFAIEKMNVREVLLLGGEPTISKHLIPLIQWLSTLGLDKIVMTTNGMRMAKSPSYCSQLLTSGLTHINISFMNLDIGKRERIANAGTIAITDIKKIHNVASSNGVKLRINNNIFRNNNDYLREVKLFYAMMSRYSDSIKFSPLLEVDSFSVVNVKTAWAKENRLPDETVESLFNEIQDYYANVHDVSVIHNDNQFGFVKNSLIPLKVPIILNWNFGNYTGMMSKVVNERKINNIKLLPNNELSLSWNREMPKYFINTGD